MTWTYSGNPSSSDRDAVRALIGDTDTTDQLLSDEEIAFALTEASNAIYAAAALCIRMILPKFARLVDTSIESVSVRYGERVKSFTELLGQLESKADAMTTVTGAPILTGISVTEMDSVRQDSDRVPPNFDDGQFDNPPFGYTQTANNVPV